MTPVPPERPNAVSRKGNAFRRICASARWFHVMALMALTLTALPSVASANDSTVPAYLLVLDQSESMVWDKNKGPDGKTYLASMRERAQAFIGLLPDGADLWIALFSRGNQVETFPIRGQADRDRAIAYLEGRYTREHTGRATQLYDTMALALDYAEEIGSSQPMRTVNVMVYTDGKDMGSKAFCKGANGSCADSGMRSICSRTEGRVKKQDIWIFLTRIDRSLALPIPKKCGVPAAGKPTRIIDSEPKIPLPIRVSPLQASLESPRDRAQSPLQLTLQMPPAMHALLENRTVGLKFVPDAPLGEVRVQPSSFEIPRGQGATEIALTVVSPEALSRTATYSGQLLIDWPESATHVVQGPDAIGITYAKGGLTIFDVRPSADNRMFATGQPVHFVAETLQDAQVTWKIEALDAQGRVSHVDVERTGAQIQHAFDTPGKRRVSVQARRGEDEEASWKEPFILHIVDLGLTINGPSECHSGQKCKFTASGDPGFTTFQWTVNGRRVSGEGANGSLLVHAFSQAGEGNVRVRGTHARLTSPTPAIHDLAVLEGPDLTVTALHPRKGTNPDAVDLATPLTLRANTAGPIEQVVFVLEGPGGLKERLDPVPVQPNGAAEKSHVFDEGRWGNVPRVSIRAEAILREGLDIPTISPPLELGLGHSEVEATITVKDAVHWGKPVTFELECVRNCEEVTWEFGDGGRENTSNSSPVHTYREYGAFTVQAHVKGKGGQSTTVNRDVTVKPEAPEARFEIRYEGDIAGKVPMGGTVELINTSTGDVARHVWAVNGNKLPDGVAKYALEEEQKYDFTLTVVDPSGKAAPVATGSVIAYHYDHAFFAFGLLLILALLAGWTWVFIENAPAAWSVRCAELGRLDNVLDVEERMCAQARTLRMRSKWSRFKRLPKRHSFKLTDLLPVTAPDSWRDSYFEKLTIQLSSNRAKGRLRGTLGFPRDRHTYSDVQWGNAAGSTQSWTLIDMAKSRRPVDSDERPTLVFHVLDGKDPGPTDNIALAAGIALAGFAIWYLYNHVYIHVAG